MVYVRCPPLISSLTLFPFSPQSVIGFPSAGVFPQLLQILIPLSRTKLPEQNGHFERSGSFFSETSTGFSLTLLFGFSFFFKMRNLRTRSARRFSVSLSWPVNSSCPSGSVEYSVSSLWMCFTSRSLGFFLRPNQIT